MEIYIKPEDFNPKIKEPQQPVTYGLIFEERVAADREYRKQMREYIPLRKSFRMVIDKPVIDYNDISTFAIQRGITNLSKIKIRKFDPAYKDGDPHYGYFDEDGLGLYKELTDSEYKQIY